MVIIGHTGSCSYLVFVGHIVVAVMSSVVTVIVVIVVIVVVIVIVIVIVIVVICCCNLHGCPIRGALRMYSAPPRIRNI